MVLSNLVYYNVTEAIFSLSTRNQIIKITTFSFSNYLFQPKSKF